LKINILKTGLLAAIQDSGRPARLSDGVPSGGAADAVSHRIANYMAGNGAGAATVEVSGGGFSALVMRSGWLACSGAGGALFLDNIEIAGNRAFFVPEGSVLEIRPAPEGNYAYLAASGGWNVPEVLGSRSTCLPAGFGGLEGRALRKGDVLNAAGSPDDLEPSGQYGKIGTGKWFVPGLLPRMAANARIIRVLPGPENGWWSEEDERRFFHTEFTVSAHRDRMGVRLDGPPFPPANQSILLSTAVMPGTVQVPPGGQPIALLADAQTTGGYPRIAQVIAVDIPRLAQIPAGQVIRFHKVTLEEAERLYFEQENLLRKIQFALQFKLHERANR